MHDLLDQLSNHTPAPITDVKILDRGHFRLGEGTKAGAGFCSASR